MYESWIIQRWETPLSRITRIAMASLIDDGHLAITFEAPRQEGRPRWRFVFERYPGYRNLMEEYRLQLWEHLDSTQQRCGNTFIVESSPWIVELRQKEGVFDAHFPTLFHYVFLTEDDVVEVLSPTVPLIQELGPTPEGTSPAGKSVVFYNTEDREQVEALFSSLRDNGPA